MLWRVFKWLVIVFVAAFIILVVWRMFVLEGKEDTAVQVEKIHNTKLTLGDVMGENLPPVPENPDATVVGVDANKNGIRDDVELAIFKEYPNSARTRAVLLQYALALQMEVTQELVNTGTVISVVQEGGRAHLCVGEILSRANINKYIAEGDMLRDFVEQKQWNTEERREADKRFYDKLGSYESLDRKCDIDYSTLPN